MQLFASLILSLNNATKTNDKRDLLVAYLRNAPATDRIWLLALFTGRRPKRLVNTTLLKQWCMELADIKPWLFDEAYHTVGDLSEAIALMLPSPNLSAVTYELAGIMEAIRQLQSQDDAAKRTFILAHWAALPKPACIVFNKLIIGGFRIGVSDALVIQAVALFTGQTQQAVAHMTSGAWDPYATDFESLFHDSHMTADSSKPYPFYLAHPVEDDISSLGTPDKWQVEWKWDGIRGQLIKREGAVYLWSRGEDLLTERFPELSALLHNIPDGTVLDGEILAFRDGLPIAFQYLQTRINRNKVSKKQLEEAPVVFMAYDVLECEGNDIRTLPQEERRSILESIIAAAASSSLLLSEVISFTQWGELTEKMTESRSRFCEGFMLKRKSSPYGSGRRRGHWWKWKIEPLSLDAVLLYAQKGSGKRSGLYTDYTFAVREGERFVPFAKAYSGLTDKEIGQVDKFIKANSLEQFGPVRTVKPELVFEIGFEGIGASPRHKSGVAVRFPRMLKWRTDKTTEDINTLDDLKKMLELYGKK